MKNNATPSPRLPAKSARLQHASAQSRSTPFALALVGASLGAALGLAACGDDTNEADTGVADTSVEDAGNDAADDVTQADISEDAGDDAGDDAADAIEETTEDADDDTTTQPAELLTLEEAVTRVDPFIGTGGIGFGYASLSPAAQLPAGFVKVGPDTTMRGIHPSQSHFSGYYATDQQVRGFSHIRLVGTGATDLGNLRFLPMASLNDSDPWVRYANMDKDSEAAAPGRYSVRLPDEGVTAAMSATNFGAIHDYAFDGGAYLQIDAGAAITDSGTEVAHVTVEGTNVSGYVEHHGGFTGRSTPFTLYFDIELNTAPTSVAVWDASGVQDAATATGERGGAILGFADGTHLEARVGLSLVDADSARANRIAEVGDSSFDDIAADAATAWEGVLDNVRIAGGTEREQSMFYSALYNAYRMPSNLTEPDGRYVGFDGLPHDSDGTDYYSDLSMWDTFRTLHPWYSLTDHALQRECLQSMLRMDEFGDRGVPNWPAMLSYTGSMIGSSSDIVFGDAAAKGVEGIDWTAAYHALYDSAYGRTQDPPLTTGRDGIEDYVTYGYLPADLHDEAVSKTLEYGWDDFGLASVARAAGLTAEAEALEESARSYLNLFKPEDGFMWPRNADGSWDEEQTPTGFSMRSGNYTEGNAWHWRWYGWHDADAFVGAYDDNDLDLAEAIEAFMSRSALGRAGRPNSLAPDTYYWHGNEPALHSTNVFHLAGQPDRASYWIRQAQERLYNDTPDGIPGNDDGGTLSTWYLFSAIGLYPVAGSDLYYLNAPLFEQIEVELGGGGTLTIEAPGANHDTYVIDEITLNGTPLEGREIRHADLVDATLHFTLSEPADE